MCGIAGYVCKDEYKQELDIMLPLLGVFMQDRGVHSWGYTDGVNIDKYVGALEYSFGPEHRGAIQAALHTRHATQGEKTAENSHPWEFDGKLIGMHNGIVHNHRELNIMHGRKFEVDSMHIFQHIVEKRDLSEIEAYGAIVYWHEGKTWLGRFNAGDLTIARAPWGIVYASTKEAVENAFRMAGLPEPTYYQVDAGVLYFIEDGTLYKTDSKLNFSPGLVTTKWDDFDWQTWQGSSWLEGEARRSQPKLTEQSDSLTTLSADCEMCCLPFGKGDNRNYMRDGWLCDECVDEMRGELIGDVEESGVHVYSTTVREWLNINSNDEREAMLSCDSCYITLLVDDQVLVVDDGGATELYCTGCKDEAYRPLTKEEQDYMLV